MRKILLLIIIGTIFSCDITVHKDKSIIPKTNKSTNNLPEKIGLLNDFEKVFTNSQKTELKTIVENYKLNNSRNIYIITTSETFGYKDYDFLMAEFFAQWKISELSNDSKVVILLSKKNRKFAISQGTEIQKHLSNEKLNEIVENKVIPELKNNEFFNGTKNAVEELIKVWK
ncbi:TPM domain-containing protein [Winogradskyella sp. PC D3.3]